MKSEDKIYSFLKKVDQDFPVPLSQKTDLRDYANKLCEYATICTQEENEEIIAMVAGYINDSLERKAYISLVATLEKARRRGLASVLIDEFIDEAINSKMRMVHLFTSASNTKAINMYKQLGFVESDSINEDRPNDIHFVLYIGG